MNQQLGRTTAWATAGMFLVLGLPGAIQAKGGGGGRGGGGRGGASHTSTSGQAVHVNGYTHANGTYVAPHMRSHPDGNFSNNWSTSGNVNPYTGVPGTRHDAKSPGYPASASPEAAPTAPASPATILAPQGNQPRPTGTQAHAANKAPESSDALLQVGGAILLFTVLVGGLLKFGKW